MPVLSKGEKYSIADKYAKKFNDHKEADKLDKECMALADKIYFSLFSEYQLLLEMLPKALLRETSHMSIRANGTNYYLFLSEERYLGNHFELDDNSDLLPLLKQYENLTKERDYLRYQVKRHINDIFYKIEHYTSKKLLFKDFPELR